MKIQAISKFITCENRLFSGIRRRVLPELQKDIFEYSKPKTFKQIKLKTAEKLYHTDFVPSGAHYGEHAFPTFVLDKKTGEAVEVLVIPRRIKPDAEDFYILNPEDLDIIGERNFGVDDAMRSITEGSMSAYSNHKYQGLGIREHQIAIERMLSKKMEKIQICSTPIAYDFHKKCGFEAIRKYNKHYDEMDFINEVAKYSIALNTDEKTIRDLMVYKKKKGGLFVVDENSSIENFVKYANKNNIPISGENFLMLCVNMKLPKKALHEWMKLIRKSPILYGKSLPKAFVSKSLP